MKNIPLKEIVPLLKATVCNWQNDRAPRLGAALAFYMALSLAPMSLLRRETCSKNQIRLDGNGAGLTGPAPCFCPA